MNVEQRLVEAFDAADRVEPSDDLWERVLHSIDEDRRHRRRVVGTIASVTAATLVLIAVGALSIEDGAFGRVVHRPTMIVLELVALVALLLALGPAIRRFGRGYAADLWPAGASLPDAMLRLLDLAYYLVGAGYILLSTELELSDEWLDDRLGGQLANAAARIGGLLLTLGILHAATFVALPLVALVDAATRVGKRLPLWVTLLLVLTGVGALVALQLGLGFGLSAR